MLFAPWMKNQRDSFTSVLVVLESLDTGAVVAQQILKFSSPLQWSMDNTMHWLQLVEKKLHIEGAIDPVCLQASSQPGYLTSFRPHDSMCACLVQTVSWSLPIRRAIHPESGLNVCQFFGAPVRLCFCVTPVFILF